MHPESNMWSTRTTVTSIALGATLAVAACRSNTNAVGDASTSAADLPVRTKSERGAPPSTSADGGAGAAGDAAAAAATPSWVPDGGRLTIVEAPNLRENLGLSLGPDGAAAPPAAAVPTELEQRSETPAPPPGDLHPSAADPIPWSGTTR
jgi:hypothetical protein